MIIDQKARVNCDFIDIDQATPLSAVAIELNWEFNPKNVREIVPIGSRRRNHSLRLGIADPLQQR